MCYPIRHGDAFRPAAMVTGRTANNRMDWIAVTDGIIKTLDQNTSATFATAEARGLIIVGITPAMHRESSIVHVVS